MICKTRSLSQQLVAWSFALKANLFEKKNGRSKVTLAGNYF